MNREYTLSTGTKISYYVLYGIVLAVGLFILQFIQISEDLPLLFLFLLLLLLLLW